MLVNFIKMHGLGNDFVVLDLIAQNVKLSTAYLKQIANRNFGIGCDQIIIIEPPIAEDRDFYYRIFNADGFEVEQCGNGARCAARYFYDSGYIEPSRSIIKADCLAGPLEFYINSENHISVNMKTPIFELERIPMLPSKSDDAGLYTCDIEGQKIHFFPVSMGNPHIVIKTQDIKTIDLKKLGSLLTKNPLFPRETNVEFMQIIEPHHIRLRVYERGVGETQACGSGACAAAVAGIKQGLLQSPVTVSFSSGDLKVRWEGGNDEVYLSGPTTSVFIGRFRL